MFIFVENSSSLEVSCHEAGQNLTKYKYLQIDLNLWLLLILFWFDLSLASLFFALRRLLVQRGEHLHS